MHGNPNDLFSAVFQAARRELTDLDKDDHFLFEDACYILQSWGYGPGYHFGHYMCGPFSMDLFDDWEEACALPRSPNSSIPAEAVERLGVLFSKGDDYLQAYAVLLFLKDENPKRLPMICARAKELHPEWSRIFDEVLPEVLSSESSTAKETSMRLHNF